MQEDVTVEGDHVVVPKGLKLGANRRLSGEDVAAGRVVLSAGTVLEGNMSRRGGDRVTQLAVRRRLEVAIFSTGDEVVEPVCAARPRGDLRFQPFSAGRIAGNGWARW